MEPENNKSQDRITVTAVFRDSNSAPKEKTKKRVDHMATVEDDDERLLAQIGYTQVCFYFSFLETS